MIGKVADVEVRMPPYEALGRFTEPGNPERILEWIEGQDLEDVSAIVASTDMIGFGGLIQSRVNQVDAHRAIERIRRLLMVRKRYPKLPLYLFSATMRLAPTATKESAPFRLSLARYVELEDKARRTKIATSVAEANRLFKLLPPAVLADYRATRRRNHLVQMEVLRYVKWGLVDYFVVGQDDARPFGPHVGETERLSARVKGLGVGRAVYFCEGIDQHSNVLISRALLKQGNWTPSVRILYSDEAGRKQHANFESKTIDESLRDQIEASGAVQAAPNSEDYDYTLYLNTPQPRPGPYREFLNRLRNDIDQGFPVAVADINLQKDGTADPLLFETLWDGARAARILSFAGWNTAGNTMGTSIPAANVYLLARRRQVDPIVREVAHREFLLHRFVNDFAYHKFTRPQAYRMIDRIPGASREETGGPALQSVNAFVQSDLSRYLDEYFRQKFYGQRFFAGFDQYVFSGISDVKIWLPWPRAYEVRLEFHLQARPIHALSAELGR
jgi:hypothetical protein